MTETPNQPIKSKIKFQKQGVLYSVCLVPLDESSKLVPQMWKGAVFLAPQMWKGAKNLYGNYPPEFEGSTQNQEKMPETPNQPIKSKEIQKQYVW
jgi:hypothetical protein